MAKMLKCYGEECPIKEDCYRYTQPYTKRNAFAAPPYNHDTGSCEYFHTNIPDDELIRLTAYYIWLRDGRPADSAQANWDEAYRTLCLSTGRIRATLI